MNYALIFILFATLLSGANSEQQTADLEHGGIGQLDMPENLLATMTQENLQGFSWFNNPDDFTISDGVLKIDPGDTTDFFNDAATGKAVATAPMLSRKVSGNFVATAKVKPNFKDIWNASALMVYQDSNHWGKLCYENSDASGPTVVTVVTHHTSDDANGPIISKRETLWLRIARKDKIFAMYWSLDGIKFTMTRIFALSPEEDVTIGMVAQCPAGQSVIQEFQYFAIEEKTFDDMRKGE